MSDRIPGAAFSFHYRIAEAYTLSLSRSSMSKTTLLEGKTFLAENASKPGVVTTASGLQYLVLAEGSGSSPRPRDSVVVHYRGTNINGIEFDSSHSRGEPSEFPLKRVIKGWIEGLQLMREGSKFMFYIPSKLAYGPRGAPPEILPDETLLFEIELIKVWED
jgi:FKBP-type peptidyl-prolyl cis-trans isomerase FkpA